MFSAPFGFADVATGNISARRIEGFENLRVGGLGSGGRMERSSTDGWEQE